jgi:hypothetical protein
MLLQCLKPDEYYAVNSEVLRKVIRDLLNLKEGEYAILSTNPFERFRESRF